MLFKIKKQHLCWTEWVYFLLSGAHLLKGSLLNNRLETDRFTGLLSWARPTKQRGVILGKVSNRKSGTLPRRAKKKKGGRKKPEEGLALAARVWASRSRGAQPLEESTGGITAPAPTDHGCGPGAVPAAAAAVDAGLPRPGVLPPPGGVPPLQVRDAPPLPVPRLELVRRRWLVGLVR